MLGQNNNKDLDSSSVETLRRRYFTSIRRIVLASAVAVLLFPNLISIGFVAAEELSVEEPPVEDVEIKAPEVIEGDKTIDEAPPVEDTIPNNPEEIEGTPTTPEDVESVVTVPEEPADDETIPVTTAVEEEMVPVTTAAKVEPEVALETTDADPETEVIENTTLQVAQEVESYPIGFQVRNMMTESRTNIQATITDASGKVISGSYNEQGFWRSDEDVPVGRYTIKFSPPEGGTVGIYPGPSSQSAIATGTDNVFTIDVSSANYHSFEIVYGSFLYDDAYSIRLTILEDMTIFRDDIPVRVTNRSGEVIKLTADKGSYYMNNLPVGSYTVTFTPPKGKQVLLQPANPRQSAKSTTTKNEFIVNVDSNYINFSLSVFGFFVLVDESPEPYEMYNLGIFVQDVNDNYLTNVGVTITNADGTIIDGRFTANSWLAHSALPVGLYTVTLTPPAGMYTAIHHNARGQHAVPTSTKNVYTIDIKAENLGMSRGFFGDFVLVKDGDRVPPRTVTEEPTVPTKPIEPVTPAPVKPSSPEKPLVPARPIDEAIDDAEHDKATSESDRSEDEDIIMIYLPRTGVASSNIALGVITFVSGLGLFVIDKKRKK